MLDYPSNITREQFELIREDLESARNKTKPRKLDLYEVFCGILYILKCQLGLSKIINQVIHTNLGFVPK